MNFAQFAITLVTAVAAVFVYDLTMRPDNVGPTWASSNPDHPVEPSGSDADKSPDADGPAPATPAGLDSYPAGVRNTESRRLREEVARLERRLETAEGRIRQHEAAIGSLKQLPAERGVLPGGAAPEDVNTFRTLYEAMQEGDQLDRTARQARVWIQQERAEGISSEAADAAADAILQLRVDALRAPSSDGADFERAVLVALRPVVKEKHAGAMARRLAHSLLLPARGRNESGHARMEAGVPVGEDD